MKIEINAKELFLNHKELIERLEEKRRKYIRELILDFNPNIFSDLKEINRRLDILYADISSL